MTIEMTDPAPTPLVALLDQLDELRASAAPGPWRMETWSGNGHPEALVIEPAVVANYADADLIVTAVNAVGPLAAAVRAVLAQHERVGGDCVDCGGVRWPCPTVAAVTAALSVTP